MGGQDEWEGIKKGGHNGGRAQKRKRKFCGQSRHVQPSCVMSDTRLSLGIIELHFALISFNPCTS